MTRKGSTKTVDREFAQGRLDNARAYLEAAGALMDLAGDGTNVNPAISSLVSASIGYADALTAKFLGVVNQKDTAGGLPLLRRHGRRGAQGSPALIGQPSGAPG